MISRTVSPSAGEKMQRRPQRLQQHTEETAAAGRSDQTYIIQLVEQIWMYQQRLYDQQRQTDGRSVPTGREPSDEDEREGPYRLFASPVSHCDASGVLGAAGPSADGAGDTRRAVILSVSSAQREDRHADDKMCFILQVNVVTTSHV
ncbi:hypothetical protein ROHU_012798 [Labeo rohita]|uniref:Uncharacterized protein n=1 Tax=Labeo rohita TaxID=84645 RepID=A0A498L9M2_LABRO|nr:hypothetical protein ROHU_012798 [Labeo rohita]